MKPSDRTDELGKKRERKKEKWPLFFLRQLEDDRWHFRKIGNAGVGAE